MIRHLKVTRNKTLSPEQFLLLPALTPLALYYKQFYMPALLLMLLILIVLYSFFLSKKRIKEKALEITPTELILFPIGRQKKIIPLENIGSIKLSRLGIFDITITSTTNNTESFRIFYGWNELGDEKLHDSFKNVVHQFQLLK